MGRKGSPPGVDRCRKGAVVEVAVVVVVGVGLALVPKKPGQGLFMTGSSVSCLFTRSWIKGSE